MKLRWVVAVVVLAIASVLGACKPAAPPETRELTDDDLRALVLKLTDLPSGYALREEKLITNEDAAALTSEPEKVKALLDEWGRVGGYGTTFTKEAGIERPRLPYIVGSSVDRYPDSIRAEQAWKGEETLLQYSLSPLNAPSEIRAPALGDQSTARRMWTVDENGRELVVYWISFRKGVVVADVTTASLKHQDDKGDHAVRLARLLHERVDTRLR